LVSVLVCAILALGVRVDASEAKPAAPNGESCTLRVQADGLRNANGVVGILVFRSADGWPEGVGKAFRRGATPIALSGRAASVSIEGLPPGDYAVVALHDENKNMKLDKNLFGWPKEGFGFSDNPHVGLGAPPFREALFPVTCPVTETTIHIIYK
jgi:uncharacterized protein (DUF2141 family)